MKTSKFQKEYRTLELKIKENTGINRARIYVIVGLIIAIIKLGRVNLKKLAPLINPKRENRTNWKFGKANINFLVLGVAYKGMAIPLFWYLLDKRGNSNYFNNSENFAKLQKAL
jgi:hypothetical protein